MAPAMPKNIKPWSAAVSGFLLSRRMMSAARARIPTTNADTPKMLIPPGLLCAMGRYINGIRRRNPVPLRSTRNQALKSNPHAL